MPADDQQLRAIAFLATSCRPHGARKWDESGIYAKLAEVRDRSLGSVIIAAIQAAEDRGAETPGVIPKPGPHWRTPESAPVTSADRVPADGHCATCGHTEAACRMRWASDHEFVSVAQSRGLKRGEDVIEIVDALKAELAPMREPAHAEDRPTVTNPAANAARAAMHEET